jgi:nitrate reductase delta subunit
MIQTFKVLSLLLSYPSEDIKDGAGELRAAIGKEALLSKQQMVFLNKLIAELETRDLYDLQECYVLLFDRTRSLSLHMFEHVHGEGSDRGQAMLDLKEMYEKHGHDIAASELPDFLPLFLEFLSTQSLDDARELLNQPLHIIAGLRKRLQKRGSVYASVFRALEGIASGKPSASRLKDLLSVAEDDPEDFQQLDETWEDEQVTFGPGAASQSDGCNPGRIATRLRAAKRPAPGPNISRN